MFVTLSWKCFFCFCAEATLTARAATDNLTFSTLLVPTEMHNLVFLNPCAVKLEGFCEQETVRARRL